MASEALDFVMNFVGGSKRYKDQFIPKWQEVMANFLVEPDYGFDSAVSPYERRGTYSTRKRSYGIHEQIILKDPETHKVVMTYASKLVKALFGNREREFVQARPVGWEDAAQKSPTVTKLIRYAFNRQGHYRTFVEGIIDMLLFGTAIIEVSWKYQEERMLVRTFESMGGIETSTEGYQPVVSYDDVLMRCVSVEDFYPDPSEYRIHDMKGAAKRFKMTAARARKFARMGIYSSDAVELAAVPSSERDVSETWRDDKPQHTTAASDFKEMIGYEYIGETPWDDEGKRVVTILNGQEVRNEPYHFADYCLPWHSLIINPMSGRFYGKSPAEVIRYDQSFADAVKMLVAEAIVRSVHPPIAADVDADVDVAALKEWKADAVVAARGGPSAVGTLRYDANFQAAFAVQAQLTASMQGTSGATGAIQGEEGPDREAATVGAFRLQAAMDRPELAAMVLENDCLPPIGLAILNRYQQFLQDTEDLKLRVGEQPEPIWIGDIMGQYDVEFIGSRQAITRQEKLQGMDRMIAYAGVSPAFQMMLPNMQIAQHVVGDLLQAPELLPMVGSQDTIAENVLAQLISGQGQGGPAQNGVPPESEPAGMLPAQASGNLYGG